MSLEAALNRNSDLLEKLIAVFQSGALTAAPQPDAAKTTSKASTKKTETPTPTPAPTPVAAQLPSVNDGKTLSVKLQAGDPDGTRYFHIAKHNTVAAIKPGEPIPSIEGIVETDGDEYAALKAKYSPPVLPTGATGAPTASPVAAPAAATPAASSASSSAPETPAQVALDGPAIVAKCQALHKVQGNDGLKKVLDKFAATNVPGLIAKTAQFAEIAAFIESLLNPQPAAAETPPNLFG